MERVGRTWIGEVSWQTSFEHLEVTADVNLCGVLDEDVQLRIRLQVGDRLLVDDTLALVAGRPRIARGFRLDASGLDQLREALAWSPERPTLVDAHLELRDVDDQLIDQAWSYTAIRAVGTAGGRFLLNGRPYPLRMVLDHGYWPQSGLTPPDDDALRRDIELTKAMGFNGVRKHQKIEDPRYLHWADRLGLLVWIEMPSAYRFTDRSIARLVKEWIDVVRRDMSHPCVVAWVPFNESWGVPNLPDSKPERHYVEAIYHLTKTLDPSRPVVGNDGWESVATDILGIHDYDGLPERLARRYATPE